MNVQPLHDFVVVNKDDAPTQTPGGIFMPGTVEDKFVTGTVTVVGPGRLTSAGVVVPLQVSVGDRVVFNKSMGIEVKLNGETALLVREEQVLCVLK
ncbi:GroS Co-chaperonin GroES (HSP10) [uncultured Caudovirales phage]|uniref:GroS Co-chaperonin GroES (HSP10) n=1 Tax=uncultured Caudovirales phage TaxID=2100421 RepID=A0A6J5RIQ5_9CAUD|nr:GroS Co-chaperonin GroES (HSP10) [uncultured Caudovirales phage]